ncbi:Cuticular protein 65Az [Carabus blaptoides fortunei]
MKLFIVLLLVVAAALALPIEPELQAGVIPILKREEVRDEQGQYVLEYVSGDGTSVNEEGSLIPAEEGPVLVKKGTIKYTSPEGDDIVLSYYADETGFHPTGDHLPKLSK